MSTGNAEPTPQAPAPHFEAPLPPAVGERAPERGMERPSAPETQKPSPQPKPATDQPAPPPPPLPATPPPAAPPTDNSQQTTSLTKDLHAEEADLIEKEWVQKAKHIVSATQDDPYKQKSEISKAKADYIQKRFNKTIKVDDAAVS